MWNNEWKKGVDYPEWGDTDVYKKTISGGYLLYDESPRDAYQRVCKTVARRLDRPELAETFFDYIWKGWLNLASPVLSNTGTDRGLPISCFAASRSEMLTSEYAKLLRVDLSGQTLVIRFLIISGKVGLTLLALYLAIQVLIVASLFLALA